MTPLAPANILTTTKTDYCGNVIYENGALSRILTEEGYITLSESTPTYHYYLRDHEGNNRVVLNQSGTVEQVNHYYPFGGLMGESTAGGVQPYKYNGKELDRMHGLDLLDYGARYYDAALGRWFVVDPLAEKNYLSSPYVYATNNPIRYIDPLGLDTFNINVRYKTVDRITIEGSEKHTYIVKDGDEILSTTTLNINDKGLVKFPSDGLGFGRYGKEDSEGDHYLKADAAASLFGLSSDIEKHWNAHIEYGDMSNEQGGAPGGDHKMHGGINGYSGVCVDYRYLDENFNSYQGTTSSSRFNAMNNAIFLNTSEKWGFTKNYISNKNVWLFHGLQILVNGKRILGHDDHGHLTYIKNR
jgi:RHS repeat-associated protein